MHVIEDGCLERVRRAGSGGATTDESSHSSEVRPCPSTLRAAHLS